MTLKSSFFVVISFFKEEWTPVHFSLKSENNNERMNGPSSLIRPGGKSYALTGEQSNKESTARAHNSGLKQFDTFLKAKNVDIQFGARNA